MSSADGSLSVYSMLLLIPCGANGPWSPRIFPNIILTLFPRLSSAFDVSALSSSDMSFLRFSPAMPYSVMFSHTLSDSQRSLKWLSSTAKTPVMFSFAYFLNFSNLVRSFSTSSLSPSLVSGHWLFPSLSTSILRSTMFASMLFFMG